ncbi:hypothetical protein M9458_002386, partial [Cirrhinus mrigala]
MSLFCVVPLPCLFVTFWTAHWYFDVLPVFRDFAIVFALDITVCLEIDPTCLTTLCSIKARTWIYHASLESPLQNTSPPQRSSSFWTQITMNPASRLLCLRQGNRAIEDYVADFCEVCHLVDFNDVALKGIFCNGIKDSLYHQMPDNKCSATLQQYIDFALLLAGSPFTVGIADEGPRNPAVTPIPQPAQVMSTKPQPSHAKPAKPEPVHVMSSKPKPAHVMPAKPKSPHVTSTKSQFTHVTSSAPRPVHVTSSAPGPAHAMPATPGPAHAMPARPESVPVMAALPQPGHKMATIPEPVHKMAAIPEA